MLGHVPQQAELVRQLVQLPPAAIDGVGRDLPDQRQHRRPGAIGGQQRRPGIQDAWARHHGEGLRISGGQGRAKRHIAGGLFMAGMEQPYPTVALGDGVEQVVVVHARQGIERVDAMGEQGIDHGFSGGLAGHWFPPDRCHPGTAPADLVSCGNSREAMACIPRL